MTRPLYKIAQDIRADAHNWQGNRGINYAAKPYVDAMATLDDISERYDCDSGKMIVLYFLGNAATWRGETARQIKLELKQMVGAKSPPVRGC